MNEIGYCAENGKDLHSRIRRKDLGDGRRECRAKADHQGSCPTATTATAASPARTAIIYFALGFPSNSGFADPDNHGWTDIPNDPFWVKHQDGHGTTPHDPVCRDIVAYRTERADPPTAA